MRRGRPIGSLVRERVASILSELGRAYGYQIHKEYIKRFPATTRENIYYHLKAGVVMGVFRVVDVKTEKGRFSWGGSAEKRYYSLGK